MRYPSPRLTSGVSGWRAERSEAKPVHCTPQLGGALEMGRRDHHCYSVGSDASETRGELVAAYFEPSLSSPQMLPGRTTRRFVAHGDERQWASFAPTQARACDVVS